MLDLPARSGPEAVRLLHETLVSGNQAVTDPASFLAGVLDRMALAPVNIAPDVALPHARTDAVTRMVLAVGRAEQPIVFDAGHPAVRLVFLIGTPKHAVSEYLQAVAALSRLLRTGGTREALYAARDEAEFRAVLSGGGVAAPR